MYTLLLPYNTSNMWLGRFKNKHGLASQYSSTWYIIQYLILTITKSGQQITRWALMWHPQGKGKDAVKKHLTPRNRKRDGKRLVNVEARGWKHLETQTKRKSCMGQGKELLMAKRSSAKPYLESEVLSH